MTGKIVACLAALIMLSFAISMAGQSRVAIERVGVGIVSTDRNETFPAVDPATGSLWFSVYDDSFDAQTIVFSRRTESGWATPEVAPFSGVWGDRAPRFVADGSPVIFSSNRPLPGAEAGSDMNIWSVQRTTSGWGEPEPMDMPVNSLANDMHASMTHSTLWLASNREGSLGRSDIYRFDADGALHHLSAPINDARSQPDLWVSNDDSWMILVISNHPEGYGGDDLYLSRFDGNAWSTPQNLGPEVNTDEYEYGPSVSPDGEYLYFTSHRSGSADLYRVRVSSVIE